MDGLEDVKKLSSFDGPENMFKEKNMEGIPWKSKTIQKNSALELLIINP